MVRFFFSGTLKNQISTKTTNSIESKKIMEKQKEKEIISITTIPIVCNPNQNTTLTNTLRENYKNHGEIKAIVFDLDNTIYHPSTGLLDKVMENIVAFWKKNCNFKTEEEYQEKSNSLAKIYGSALQGFILEYPTHFDSYKKCISEGLNYQEILKKDDELVSMVRSIKPEIKKWVFSNSPHYHVEKSLEALGFDVQKDWNGMITLCSFEGKFCKPDIRSFLLLKDLIDIPLENCVFIDDCPKNAKKGSEMGMKSIHIHHATKTPETNQISNIMQLKTHPLTRSLFSNEKN